MNISSDRSNIRATSVAFVNCFDGGTFSRTVYMTAFEERHLRGVLATLRDFGFILEASIQPSSETYGFPEVIDHFRSSVGRHFVKAALAAAGHAFPSTTPAPAAVMPVWAFEPDGANEDVMLSSGTLWGSDLLLEALRVEDADDPVAVPAARARFDRWTAAAGITGPLSTTRLPGREGCYVVFAAASPA